MNKIVLYIDSMGYGGAQRVISVIANYFFSKGIYTILINDVETSNEYRFNVNKRIVLTEKKRKSNFSRILAIRRIIKNEEPTAVLSFMGPPNIRMLLATIGCKTKKVVSVRNDPNYEYGKGPIKFFSNLIFALSDAVVFQTPEAQKYFSKRIQRKSHIICNPISEQFFLKKWNAESEEIAVVGRLQPQKNPLLVLNAFSLIADSFPSLRLTFYGDGELKEQLCAKAKVLKIEERVNFAGNVSNLETYLYKARVFVLPSNFEGMPNALMEAMAIGLPIISTDCPCGGPRFLLENGKNGILVKCNDVGNMSEAISFLLNNKATQIEISKNERESALRYKSSNIMKQWEEILL